MLTEEPTRSSHVDEQHHIDVDQEKLQIDQEPSTEALEDLKEEKWNYPKRNILRLASVYLAFFNIGLNDASFTALRRGFQSYYNLSYVVALLTFSAAFIGYGLAAILSDPIHHKFGQRGAAFLIPVCRLICYVLVIYRIPWAGIVVSIAIAGFGNGISQGVWNSWLVGMPSVNELMGFMHGFYGLGALITPLIAKAMVQTYGQPFWNFYYIMFGMNVLELILGVYAFWTATGDAHRAKLAKENQNTGGRMKGAISHTVTWMVSIFLFIYVATEVSLGGWISTFMTVINGGSLSDANTITTSFWASLTAGRMILGFVTPKFDEHLAVLTYLLICTFLQIFWLICYFARSAVIVGLQGFFIGPMFPSAVVLVSRILPAKLHVMAISFSAATGAGGTAILPFAIRLMHPEREGSHNEQAFVLACTAGLCMVWLLISECT